MEKICIKNLSIDQAVDFFRSIGEKDIRAQHLLSWLYVRNISSFYEITLFSKKIRGELSNRFTLTTLEPVDSRTSSDGSAQKFLFRTHDGNFIESVLLVSGSGNGARKTICVSTQAGCAMGCSFCATARDGFARNLDSAEILDQVCRIRSITGLVNSNVVFMGMGEPYNNYDNCLKAAEIMNYSYGLNLSARKITISTCGILPGIKRFIAENRPFNLAISVNDTDPLLRAKNMPVEKAYPIKEIAEYIRTVKPANHGGKITLEYVMRKDNISRHNAERLHALFGGTNIKINLIPLNAVGPGCEVPRPDEIEEFIRACISRKLPINIRQSLGGDIDGACGQLSGKYRQQRV